MNRYQGYVKEFNKLENDYDRWVWIRDRQHLGIVVMLDNDDTFGIFESVDPIDEDIDVLQIQEYIGNGPGISSLLSFAGIKHDSV